MHDAGCLGLVHWDDPEGWYGEGGGRKVQDGEHMYNFFKIKIELKKNKIKNFKKRKKNTAFRSKELDVHVETQEDLKNSTRGGWESIMKCIITN